MNHQVLPKPNLYFVENFILAKPKPINDFSVLLIDSKSRAQFFQYSIIKLDGFKHNYLIVNKNYILYLLNTPDNLLISFCLEQINYYYHEIFNREIKAEYICVKEHAKYELVSLYHNLGKRLILYCLKYMYTQYINYFSYLAVKGELYKKYTVTILDRNFELDFFLSFTEFKNTIIKEFYDLDTGDIIEYGRDMYRFTIFNLYLYNLNLNKSYLNFKPKYLIESSGKAIIKHHKGNVGYLGHYYPSRN